MSWCKAVVDEVQTGKASYVGGSTSAVPSTSVSTASQANAYNQPTSVSYSSSGVQVMSHHPQQQPIPAWQQYPQQPTVYSQYPGALQYHQQPPASVCTNRQPAPVLQYPQQPPVSQHVQQPAAQPQSLQVPNAAKYFKHPPVSQPSQQSSALQYPYQSGAVQNPVYQAPRYYRANVTTERPMASYASVVSSHLPHQQQQQPSQQQQQHHQPQAFAPQVAPSTAAVPESSTHVMSEHGNYPTRTQHDKPGYPQQTSDYKPPTRAYQMPQHQGTASQHQPVYYGTPSLASLAPATMKEHYNPMQHTQQNVCVTSRRAPESGLIQARRAAYATRNESQQPLSQAPQPPEMAEEAYVNKNFISKSPMPGTERAEKEDALPGGNIGRNWPDSLDKYVKKCFSLANTQTQQAEVGITLREAIRSALEDDCLWTKDWESEPLPKSLLSADVPTPTETPNTNVKRKRQRSKKSKSKSKTQELVETGGISSYGGTSEHKLAERMKRFAKNARNGPQATATLDLVPTTMETEIYQIDDCSWWDLLTVKGTCTDLEKEYLRLTSVPDPATVRPEPVLRQALDHHLQRWELRSTDPKGINYESICSQLKAIRQDLTIQRIRNDLTINAYEAHARIAICEGDLNEFNQCQTQLHLLRKEGLVGCEDEFVAYRVLYYAYLMTNERYAEGSKDMLQMMMEVHNRWSGCSVPNSVAHSLQVRKAMALGDYHMWFILLKTAQNLSGELMQQWADKTRLAALRRMIRAYKPSIPVNVVVNELAFNSNDEALEFLTKCGIVVKEGEVDCKASRITTGVLSSSNSTLL